MQYLINDPTNVESPPQDHVEDVPGRLPDYEPVSKPSNVYWGHKSDGADYMAKHNSYCQCVQ